MCASRDIRAIADMKYVMGTLKVQSIVNYAIRKRYLRRQLRARDTPQRCLQPIAVTETRSLLLCNYHRRCAVRMHVHAVYDR